MSSLLQAENLSGGYTQEPVIRGVSFEVSRGEFLGIIGPNGSGKSTLLRLMTRVLNPTGGRVFFEGKDIRTMDLKALFRRMAFIPQEMIINFPFTVWEIVLMGRIPHMGRLESAGKRDFECATQALARTDAGHLKDRLIDELSAGERQRVMIARALTQEPLLLFLDEPTSHLDIGHQIQILDLLRQLNRESQLTVVIVLHDLNLASEYCSRLLLLDKGMIVTQGTGDEVLTYPVIEQVYHTVVVVNANPITGKPHVLLVSGDRACPRK